MSDKQLPLIKDEDRPDYQIPMNIVKATDLGNVISRLPPNVTEVHLLYGTILGKRTTAIMFGQKPEFFNWIIIYPTIYRGIESDFNAAAQDLGLNPEALLRIIHNNKPDTW